MGEYAEAAMWAEMHGLDPADMSPEDWSDFYDDADEPLTAGDIRFHAEMLADVIRDFAAEKGRPDALAAAVPAFGAERTALLVSLLADLIAAAPDDEQEDTHG